LCLPNWQIMRSAWKEKMKPLSKVRMARDVMVSLNVYFGEVQYFFQAWLQDSETIMFALASVYSSPNQEILEKSSNALWTCKYSGHEGLQVFSVTWIKSCVAMPPLNKPADEWFFIREKMGLAVASMGGNVEDFNKNGDDNMYL
ncbi:hypothetical protein K443DRAFT_92394, partial [Laccaria amethystina LaAM-08-1]